MRQARAVLIVLVAAVPAGCFTPSAERSARAGADESDPFSRPLGANVVQMDVAVLERPAGDDFLNRGLWELADEQAVSLERKAEVEDNGFRVCAVGGVPSAGLQALLTSPRSNPDPHRFQVPSGKSVPVTLSADCPYCWFRVHADDTDRSLELKDACCCIDVVPTLTDDGRVCLRFTPRIKHGSTAVRFTPQKDPSGALHWERSDQQAEELFDRLAWDVTVAPGEFVVVGTRSDRPATLGQACFLPVSDGPRVQRLLVIRTARAAADQPAVVEPGPSAPLALRAALQTARGTGD
jgi:hypothetical protein